MNGISAAARHTASSSESETRQSIKVVGGFSPSVSPDHSKNAGAKSHRPAGIADQDVAVSEQIESSRGRSRDVCALIPYQQLQSNPQADNGLKVSGK